MKVTTFSISLLAVAALNSSCSRPPTSNNRQRLNDGGREIAEFEKYQPFPSATSVRLFVQPEPFDDAAVDKLSDARGRPLTNAEYELLKTAFFMKTIIRPPAQGYLATSCLFAPRHVFRFYDARRKRVGDALVCFECYDVKFDPPRTLLSTPFPKEGQTVLSVDYAVLLELMHKMSVSTFAS